MQYVVGDKDELYKDLIVVSKGKDKVQEQIQGKDFQPIEFTDSMPPAYEEDSTNDEYLIAKPKVIWMIKKRKKRFEVEEVDNFVIKDLIINDKQDVLEWKPKKVEDWTEQSMKEIFQEQDQEAEKSIIFGTNNFSGISDPSNLWDIFQMFFCQPWRLEIEGKIRFGFLFCKF